MIALPETASFPVDQWEKQLRDNQDCVRDNVKCMCHQIAEDFFSGRGGRNAIWIPNALGLVFFVRLAGVHSPVACTALPSPRSSIIYGAQARKCPQIHTRQSLTAPPHSQPRRSQRVADRLECCHSECPGCQCHSSTPSDLPYPATHCSSNPRLLSVAGQQGSWGWQLLYRAAEADMGEEVSNGTGRLGLIDFTSHILLRHNQRRLRNKYVCFISNARRIVSQGLCREFVAKAN